MARKPGSHVTILIYRGLLSHYNNNLYAFTFWSFMPAISPAELICLQNLPNHAFQKGLVDGLVTDFSNLGRQQEMNDSIRCHSPMHLGK